MDEYVLLMREDGGGEANKNLRNLPNVSPVFAANFTIAACELYYKPGNTNLQGNLLYSGF